MLTRSKLCKYLHYIHHHVLADQGACIDSVIDQFDSYERYLVWFSQMYFSFCPHILFLILLHWSVKYEIGSQYQQYYIQSELDCFFVS